MKRLINTLLLLLLIVLPGCQCATVDSGHEGVFVDTWGSGTDTTRIATEGFHTYAPWIDLYEYSTQTQKVDENMTVLSSNGLNMGIDLSVVWNQVKGSGNFCMMEYGEALYDRLINPVVRSVGREVVGRYTPEETYSTAREALQTSMYNEIRDKVNQRSVSAAGIPCAEIQAVDLRDVELPSKIKVAIETKLEEEQAAGKYIFTLRKARLEAKNDSIRAAGKATAQRLLASALDARTIRWEELQVQRELARSSNAKLYFLPQGTQAPQFLLNQN